MMAEQFEVNGEVVFINPTASRFSKSAFTISQEILHNLSKIGIKPNYVTLSIPRNPLKPKEPAEVGWVVNGEDHYFKCSTQDNYRDNLGVIGNVIHQEVYAIKNGMKSFGQVMNQFRLGYDETGEKIVSPREVLGIPLDIKDIDYITYKYKRKAKELHPDSGGDAEKFKELSEAYKKLKEELEGK